MKTRTQLITELRTPAHPFRIRDEGSSEWIHALALERVATKLDAVAEALAVILAEQKP